MATNRYEVLYTVQNSDELRTIDVTDEEAETAEDAGGFAYGNYADVDRVLRVIDRERKMDGN